MCFMSNEIDGESWSQWLDFDQTNVSSTPESAGVFVMHAVMKILFIGSGQNLRQALLQSMEDLCISKAKRFRYVTTQSYDRVKEQLIKEYVEKHNGELPLCMQPST